MIEVPAGDLARVLGVLLEHVQDSDGVIRIDTDEFWSVPAMAAYEPNQEPDELTIGTVTQSWEFLRTFLEAPDSAIGYGLVWVADVLRAIGYETPR
ncbi:hypothetical protein ACIRON_30145 [Nocardioides sp. NPDC101246]|uniref:hypothetical protein n=1 Tax=Nocardioides sp. NPDC101246 TaxID=3364336 RepID=UPI00380D764E